MRVPWSVWRSERRHWRVSPQHWRSCRPYPGGFGCRTKSGRKRSAFYHVLTVVIVISIAIIIHFL